MILERNYMRGRRVLFKLKKKLTGVTRPSSYPFVTGDSFRALANHIHDETMSLKPEKVRLGEVVFVSNPLIESYLKTLHREIKHPYVLIEHNGDRSIDLSITELLDEKIVRFYAQDVITDHPKIIPIPLAIENQHYYINGVPWLLKAFMKKIENHPPIKKNRVFYQFSINTNPEERRPALELFSKHKLMDTVSAHLSPRFHWKILMEYKFVISPPGHAIESCRTWEALHMKTVPIVKDFVSTRYFASIGLPIWIIKDWKELNGLTEEDLSTKYQSLMSSANWQPLLMDFWIKKIRADQESVRLIPV